MKGGNIRQRVLQDQRIICNSTGGLDVSVDDYTAIQLFRLQVNGKLRLPKTFSIFQLLDSCAEVRVL